MTRILSAVLLLCAAIAAAAPVVVTCPEEPPVVRRLELRERWRVDPADPDAPLLSFSGDHQIFRRDGRLFMLDHMLCRVHVYDDDGRLLDTILQEGDGPGEIRNPGRMLPCADGRIAVQHGYPSHLEFVDPDGTPRGRWRAQANAWLNTVQETPLGWFAVYSEFTNQESGKPLRVFHAAILDDEGAVAVDLFSEEDRDVDFTRRTSDEAAEHNPWYDAVWTDGLVVLPPERDAYRLEWRTPEGETVRTVTRPFRAHVRTEEELERLKYRGYSIVNGKVHIPETRLCPTEPMIRAVELLPDGALRVRTSLFNSDLPDGMVCRYEVHEPTGELRERVEILDPDGLFDWDYDGIALLDDGTAVILRNVLSAERNAFSGAIPPEVEELMPDLADARADMAYSPVVCDLVRVGP